MRLHTGPWSGNGYKVRLLLGLLGVECEVVDYDTKGGDLQKADFLERVNPDGKVPVLETEAGEMLPESGAILLYLAEGTPYVPGGRLERARAARWLFFEQFSLLPYLARPRLYRMWGFEMTPERRAEVEGLYTMGHRALAVMERHLGAGGGRRFFAGDEPTVADVALYAYPKLCPEGGYHLSDYPNIGEFLGRVEALPGYVPAPEFRYDQELETDDGRAA